MEISIWKLYFCLILAAGHNNCSFQGLIIAFAGILSSYKALHTYRSISAQLLISSTIFWYGNIFAVHFWMPYNKCNIHIYGGAITNNLSSNGGSVNIIKTLTYGNQEDAYHVNNAWICVEQNGVAKNRVETLKGHRVRYEQIIFYYNCFAL